MIVDILSEVVKERCPLNVRQVKFLCRTGKPSMMGTRGKKLTRFFQELNIEINNVSLQTLDFHDIFIYMVLMDHCPDDPDEVELSQRLLKVWKEHVKEGKIFYLPTCKGVIILG